MYHAGNAQGRYWRPWWSCISQVTALLLRTNLEFIWTKGSVYIPLLANT